MAANHAQSRAPLLRAAKNLPIDRLRGKSILITGATGLIGTSLTDMLLTLRREAGVAVTIYAGVRSIARAEARFSDALAANELTLVPYDASAPLALPDVPDGIIHAASGADPASFAADPVGTMDANITGIKSLLEYARLHSGTRLLFVSSGEVYGQTDAAVMTESAGGYVDSMRARSCYPTAKRAAETYCAAYAAQYGVDALVARPCHTYGPTQTARDTRAASEFLRCAAAGREIVLTSPGAQVRSFLHSTDTAAGLLTLWANGQTGEAYNVAEERFACSIRTFAEICAQAGGVPLRFDPPLDESRIPAGAIPRAVLSGEKLRALGWQAHYPIEAGIRATLDALRAENCDQ